MCFEIFKTKHNNWMIKMKIEIDNSQLLNDIVEKVVELG